MQSEGSQELTPAAELSCVLRDAEAEIARFLHHDSLLSSGQVLAQASCERIARLGSALERVSALAPFSNHDHRELAHYRARLALLPEAVARLQHHLLNARARILRDQIRVQAVRQWLAMQTAHAAE